MIINSKIAKITAFPPRTGRKDRPDEKYSGLKILLTNGEVINTNTKFFATSSGEDMDYVVDKPTVIKEYNGYDAAFVVSHHKAGDPIPDTDRTFLSDGYSVEDVALSDPEINSITKYDKLLKKGVSEAAIRLAALSGANISFAPETSKAPQEPAPQEPASTPAPEQVPEDAE